MAHHAAEREPVPHTPKFVGWMAEFAEEDALLSAARKVRDAGYTKTDAYTPFPVHGIDEALGIKPTILPWIVLVCGATGTTVALVMQIWMNAVDYPYIISGKPFISLPAFIPVAFELTILFSAFSTVIGMLALNRLVQFNRPMFSVPKFDRATDDRFFLVVRSDDRYFNKESVKELLASGTPETLDEVYEDPTPAAIPRPIWLGLALLVAFALVPLAILLNVRANRSTEPRFHVFYDMDFQPKKKPQQQTTIFADGRSERPQVIGTVARGQLPPADPFYLGYDPAQLTALASGSASRLVALQEDADEAVEEVGTPLDTAPTDAEPTDSEPTDAEPTDTEPTDAEPTDAEATDAEATDEQPAAIPVAGDGDAVNESSETTMKNEEGQTVGTGGDGSSATDLDASAGVSSTNQGTGSVASPTAGEPAGGAASATTGPGAPNVNNQPPSDRPNLPFLTKLPIEANEAMMKLGQTKYEIYCSACHGYAGDGNGLVAQRGAELAQGYWLMPTSLHDAAVRAQPVGQIYYTITNGKGKMGSYGPMLSAEERWAVVLYVRALQRARDAKIEDVPKDARGSIRPAPEVSTN